MPLRFQILVMLVFEERGKSKNPEKKPLRAKDENQQQTQPTYSVPLKSKLPVSSRFSREEWRVSRYKLDFVPTEFMIDKLAIELHKFSLLRDKGFVLYQLNRDTQLDILAKLSRTRQALVLTVFFSLRETSVSFLETRLSSLESRVRVVTCF